MGVAFIHAVSCEVRMKIGLLYFAAIFCVWGGCASKPKANEMLALAKQYAEQAGYNTSEYEVEVDAKDSREVCVFFIGKEKLPGNHFMVLINTSARTCRLVEGH